MNPQPARKVEILKAFTIAWWIQWTRLVEAGEPTAHMVWRAKRGEGWPVFASSAPTSTERAVLFVPVEIGSRGFRDWRAYFLARFHVHLPRPTKVKTIYMPSEAPPVTMSPIMSLLITEGSTWR